MTYWDTVPSPNHDVNKQKLKYSQLQLYEIEKDMRHFSICILIDDSKRVWISRRNNSDKDFFDHYQVTGGSKENKETYLECAIREIEEETGITTQYDKLHQEIFSGVIFRNFNVILNFRNFSRNITEIFENFRKLLKR
ncbi:hypothetical protein Glove_21g135 [Diversispora epigaea]|uniref:Nudix hydrolase domain-containing protein n=1 Tax=Diversispora epigaea TaxID=1348612 RepID=A0A397JK88_9GLOM|nr:hypothetical protein Glove_21g135 [Diversispora epigaea]